MKKINRVRLYTKKLDKAYQVEKIIREELLANNIEINNESYDLAISIGGDGTFLKMIHDNNFNNQIYYVGINAGSLGFLTSFNIEEIKEFIKSLNNDFNEYEIPIIKATIITDKDNIDYYSINELTIRKTNFLSLGCSVYVNDNLLEKYFGDGLVISTSVGSTGYNYSLNGPIVDNDIKSIIITPIAPINNQVYRSLCNSLIINGNKEISIIPDNNLNMCLLTDGKINELENIKKITCTLSSNSIKCIISNNHNYMEIIKAKMINKE